MLLSAGAAIGGKWLLLMLACAASVCHWLHVRCLAATGYFGLVHNFIIQVYSQSSTNTIGKAQKLLSSSLVNAIKQLAGKYMGPMPDLLPSHFPDTVQRCHLVLVSGVSVIVCSVLHSL